MSSARRVTRSSRGRGRLSSTSRRACLSLDRSTALRTLRALENAGRSILLRRYSENASRASSSKRKFSAATDDPRRLPCPTPSSSPP